MRSYAKLADVNITLGPLGIDIEPPSADALQRAVAARREAPWTETANELRADLLRLRERFAEQENLLARQAEWMAQMNTRVAALERRTWWSLLVEDWLRAQARVRAWWRRS